MTTAGAALPKYLRVAAGIRRQIAEGTLRPGQPAPSGAELSRDFGFSTLTCRKALRTLVDEGLLVPGPSPNARPRVADPHAPDLERDLAEAARALSAGLAARRHAAGLTQAELATLAGVSVTTVGHAETGRTWQSRRFWNRADTALRAAGELLRLHDAFRAASSPQHDQRSTPSSPERTLPSAPTPDSPSTGLPQTAAVLASVDHSYPAEAWPAQADAIWAGTAQAGSAPAVLAAAVRAEFGPDPAVPRRVGGSPAGSPPFGPSPVGPARIVIVWTDGTITTVHAPEVLARPPDPTARDQAR